MTECSLLKSPCLHICLRLSTVWYLAHKGKLKWNLLEIWGLPAAGLSWSDGEATVGGLLVVFLNLDRSCLTRCGTISERFLNMSVLVLDRFRLAAWVSREESIFVWGTVGVLRLLVSAIVTSGLELIPAVLLQVVDFICGSILGTVFLASAVICGELPLEVFRKAPVFILGGWSRTSGVS